MVWVGSSDATGDICCFEGKGKTRRWLEKNGLVRNLAFALKKTATVMFGSIGVKIPRKGGVQRYSLNLKLYECAIYSVCSIGHKK